jgi:hypothetical protein
MSDELHRRDRDAHRVRQRRLPVQGLQARARNLTGRLPPKPRRVRRPRWPHRRRRPGRAHARSTASQLVAVTGAAFPPLVGRDSRRRGV